MTHLIGRKKMYQTSAHASETGGRGFSRLARLRGKLTVCEFSNEEILKSEAVLEIPEWLSETMVVLWSS